MNRVDVYGADHSPWVQAVLLGLHEAGIAHSLTSLPPLAVFLNSGVMMPAARIDDEPWMLESADILQRVGYESIADEEMRLVRSAWRGVMHRTDSAALFWGGFSLAGDSDTSFIRRMRNNFLRSFVTLYFFLLIRIGGRLARSRDPENFGDQFLPFEERLELSGAPYLSGQAPNTLDFLLFGIIQCHCSVYVSPVSALQSDPRLGKLRAWIGTMQDRFREYERLYSGLYFAPHSSPPTWASPLERATFWAGAAVMWAAFPVTFPLVAFLAIRARRS
jgi:glutathione S-transferase